MRRRHWLVAVALVAAGCSSAGTSKKTKSSSSSKSSSTARRRRPSPSSGIKRMQSGPQGFGNMLVTSYIDDLKNGSADKKIAAAEALGNMGGGAKEALPALKSLTADSNPKVSAAAKAAVAAIGKH